MNPTKIQHQLSLEKWADIIRQQQASGLTINQWVTENNIRRDAFFYWKRKLKDTVIDSVTSAGFVELPVAPIQTESIPVAKLVQPTPSTETSVETVATMNIGSSVTNIYGNASQEFLRSLLGAVSHA